jgi:cob(I)alamin adenosyltransferase
VMRLIPSSSRITADMTDALDGVIDRYMSRVELPPKFVIPGGNQLSAQLDVARTIIRRAERRVVAINKAGELASTEILRFLNRASDLCFAMARAADVPDPALFEGRGARS